jgi:hypothetical protein
MDYCNDVDSTTWECARSIFLGILSSVTWLLSLIALYTVIQAHLRRKTFQLNVMMLLLTTIQVTLDWIELLGKRESRLQLMSITLRVLQTNLACLAYSTFILENRNLISRFKFVIFPGFFISFIFTLVIFILSCLEEDGLGCEHPFWLILSSFQLFLSVLFVCIGCIATREVNHALLIADVHYSQQKEEISKKRRDLWLLMTIFLLASLSQVIGDAWRQSLYQNGSSCRVHETHLEEFVRVLLFMLSFDLPAWGVLFIFYYLPRHSFDASFDVELPAVQLMEWEELSRLDGNNDEESLNRDNKGQGFNNAFELHQSGTYHGHLTLT